MPAWCWSPGGRGGTLANEVQPLTSRSWQIALGGREAGGQCWGSGATIREKDWPSSQLSHFLTLTLIEYIAQGYLLNGRFESSFLQHLSPCFSPGIPFRSSGMAHGQFWLLHSWLAPLTLLSSLHFSDQSGHLQPWLNLSTSPFPISASRFFLLTRRFATRVTEWLISPPLTSLSRVGLVSPWWVIHQP